MSKIAQHYPKIRIAVYGLIAAVSLRRVSLVM